MVLVFMMFDAAETGLNGLKSGVAVCLQGSCVLGTVGSGELPGGCRESPVTHGPPTHTTLHRAG